MAVDRFEKRKNAQLTRAQREIDAIFKVAAQEAAAIAGTVRNPNPDKVFSFNDYPQTHARIAKLEEWMAEEIEHTISNNITEEWNIAEASGEQLTTDFLQHTYQDVSRAPAALKARYYRNNTEAHDAFLARTIKGMGLSDRVWRLTAQCRQEMELAIDIGLSDGLSAQKMSRSIRQYLKEPDKLFRRVRDKHGNLVLSKAAKAYHPGQGVYRSSYKNALRLSATEGNIAYRTADHLKWQQLDFVVGIQIGLSNNHTLNGVPFHDICDELAGRYPKDFKFTGWHPFCRCIATTILMTPEEFKANEEAFLDGKEPTVRSKNEVDDVPPQFKKWVKENQIKIVKTHQLPHFITDNVGFVSNIMQSAQPNSRVSDIMMTKHFYKYLEQYRWSSKEISSLYRQLEEALDTDTFDSERAIIINQIKHTCANISHKSLIENGMVASDWVLARKEFNFVVQPKATYPTQGKLITISEVRMDILVYKDKYGKEFAYPIGAEKSLYKATTASEAIQEFPPYLRKGIKQVKFMDIECPMDAYWKVEYKNPNHKSMAMDGGKTTFYLTPKSKEDFKGYMAHEAGHIIDGEKHKISSSPEWQEAVSKDDALFARYIKGKHRVSKYALTNDCEDFAECMRAYIQDHAYFKKTFPNRAAFIRKMAQKLSGHYKS